MKTWNRRKQFLTNSVLMALIIPCVAYVLWDIPSRPIQGFTIERLSEAIENHDVLSIHYQPASQELIGRIRGQRKEWYGGDEFHLAAKLPLSLYQKISEQKLSASAFLGPVEGLDQNSEYKEALHLKETSITNPKFRTGEQAVYNIQALGMSVGQLTLEVLSPVTVMGVPSYHIQMRARTSSSVARMYRADDEAETFLRTHDLTPIAFSLRMEESERFGGMFEVQRTNGSLVRWTSVVSKTRGLQMGQNNEFQPPGAQNMASLIFALRGHNWANPKSLVLFDQGKKIEINAQKTGSQTLQTAIGPVTADIIEPQILIDGKNPPPVKIWLQQDFPHALLKIEANIKVGSVRAELVSFRETEAGVH